jgi:hypothetical protein
METPAKKVVASPITEALPTGLAVLFKSGSGI